MVVKANQNNLHQEMLISSRSPFCEGDLIFKENKVCFSCFIDCANVCCTGATLLTAKEISNLYTIFPITIIFSKISPQSEEHRLLLDMIGIKRGNHYIIGDFVAGNWRNRICRALNGDRQCSLHLKGLKPLQCLLVPFSVLYPESLQGLLIVEQRAGKFSRCQGLKDTKHTVWEKGKFKDDNYSSFFHDYQGQMIKQRDFMDKLLSLLKSKEPYREFISKKGVLHSPIVKEVFEDFIALTNLKKEKIISFLKTQERLLTKEIDKEVEDTIFTDAHREIVGLSKEYTI